jgi:hypothetical protein
MPLLLVVVVALGAYAVVRIRDTIGAHESESADAGNGDDTKPFNPKHTGGVGQRGTAEV